MCDIYRIGLNRGGLIRLTGFPGGGHVVTGINEDSCRCFPSFCCRPVTLSFVRVAYAFSGPDAGWGKVFDGYPLRVAW